MIKDRFAKIKKLPCCYCGHTPSDVAHSNFHEHGKSMGKKAGDEFTIPLCRICHMKFDTYSLGFDRQQSKAWFNQQLQITNEMLYVKETNPF